MLQALLLAIFLGGFLYWAIEFLNDGKGSSFNDHLDDDAIDKLRTKRKNIRLEILSTEKTYVNNLTILEEFFAKPIKERHLISNDKVYSTIFPKELSIILNINSVFLKKLDETIDPVKKSFQRMPDSESVQLADLLLSHAHSFKLYSTYITNYSNSVTTLRNELKENQKLKDFLAEQKKVLSERGERVTTVQDLLINPIQRLPRYKLLFEDLLAKTEPSHKGYTKLQEAVKLISNVATFCNEKEREFQNQLVLVDLMKNHKIPLQEFLLPSRRLLEKIDNVEFSDGKKQTPCQLFILTDMLICCMKQKKVLSQKEVVHVQFTKQGSHTEKGTIQRVSCTTESTNKLTVETTYAPEKKKASVQVQKSTFIFESEQQRQKVTQHISQA